MVGLEANLPKWLQSFKDGGRSDLAQVSIIITAYNVQDYIRTAIYSALAQNNVSVETIVIVDGGHDNTAKIVSSIAAEYPQIITLIKENGGVSSARNVGLKMATSDYVMFLDGDDKLLPDACNDFLEMALATSADIVVSDYFSLKEGTCIQKLKEASQFEAMSGPSFALSILAPKSTVSVWNKCYKRSLFEGVLFPENVSMGEDFLTLFDVSLKANLVVPLHKPTVVYLIRQSSLVNSSSQHLLSITLVMDMLKTRLAAINFPADVVNDSYNAAVFYHVMYSRVMRDERFGDVHFKLYQWFNERKSSYSSLTKKFVKTLPLKERLLLICYHHSYHSATLLVRLNIFFRQILAKE
jgi:glycosyltransferase involved in cell wall biosynthesis